MEGDKCPPPCKRFVDMKLPKCLISGLKRKGIKTPTPIQMQGIPCALSGRDMIGISFTGSGKTMSFAIPLVMSALIQEVEMPFVKNEGPYGLVICPSRELARQTAYEFEKLADYLEAGAFPKLRIGVAIGGTPVKETMETVRQGRDTRTIVHKGIGKDSVGPGPCNTDKVSILWSQLRVG